jgi:hypothetical protein
MQPKHKILLLVDGTVNLILGLLLLLFPFGIIDVLGLPPTHTHFYASILGAVLFGIGISLFLEVAGYGRHVRGLGIGGAIVINLAGSAVLVGWLVSGGLAIPMRGRVVLWTVGLLVILIAIAELATRSWIDHHPD